MKANTTRCIDAATLAKVNGGKTEPPAAPLQPGDSFHLLTTTMKHPWRDSQPLDCFVTDQPGKFDCFGAPSLKD